MQKQIRVMLVITYAFVFAFLIYTRKDALEHTSLDRIKHGRSPSHILGNGDSYGNRSSIVHAQRGDNSSWTESNKSRLSSLIQTRLYSLQNPADCRKARKIVCDLRTGGGFGCEVHHLSFCMIMAYGTGRTLILQSHGWNYHNEGWETFFQPLSDNCRDPNGETIADWTTPNENENIQVLKLPAVSRLAKNEKPDFLPFAIPEDIADELTKVHSKPAVWWIGEIITFIMRPQKYTKEFIEKAIVDLKFTHPIVGIHVRRTDKLIKEAKLHDIDEYMVYANEFYEEYEKREGRTVSRRIFLATDHIGLLHDAKKRYPGYMFLSDIRNTQSSQKSTRLTEESLKGIIVDTHLLALSDFLVCGFSSNVCRLAYEMMQHYHVDASSKVHSIDRHYLWHGSNPKSSGKAVKMPSYNVTWGRRKRITGINYAD